MTAADLLLRLTPLMALSPESEVTVCGEDLWHFASPVQIRTCNGVLPAATESSFRSGTLLGSLEALGDAEIEMRWDGEALVAYSAVAGYGAALQRIHTKPSGHLPVAPAVEDTLLEMPEAVYREIRGLLAFRQRLREEDGTASLGTRDWYSGLVQLAGGAFSAIVTEGNLGAAVELKDHQVAMTPICIEDVALSRDLMSGDVMLYECSGGFQKLTDGQTEVWCPAPERALGQSLFRQLQEMDWSQPCYVDSEDLRRIARGAEAFSHGVKLGSWLRYDGDQVTLEVAGDRGEQSPLGIPVDSCAADPWSWKGQACYLLRCCPRKGAVAISTCGPHLRFSWETEEAHHYRYVAGMEK